MNFGAELITEIVQTITPNHMFRLELYCRDTLLPQSAGSDTYKTNCEILTGKIIAATGRAATYGIGTGLEAVQAEPARPVSLSPEEISQLRIRIITNKILDQAVLKHSFSLRLNLSGKVIDLHLARHDVKVYWEGRGEFLIPLGEHLSGQAAG